MYKNFINKSLLKNYKGKTNFNKHFLYHYKKERNLTLLKLKKKNLTIKKNIKSDLTFLFFQKLHKKKFSDKIDKIVVRFYKKFEVNLQLKLKYNRNYKKKSNFKTNSSSYIILGELIIKSNRLDTFQKVNCILKINDVVSFSLNEIYLDYYDNFKSLILFEFNVLKKIYNEI